MVLMLQMVNACGVLVNPIPVARKRWTVSERKDKGASFMLGATDYIIIAAYFILTVTLGLYFARQWKGSEDFFLAGRSLTWPLIGLSLFATNISTEHFVGLAAGGNREGLVRAATNGSPAIAC